eukprot:TRINITY_DN7478_c0_g1_i4.p1 TRINITY_DN7478_c0_g1~~TRINITY_DN7478_c0_g1_i4.p1  ORF type:complete len:180 (-),score=12.95 TRINITY_DN7478_c0_g1_i4:129-668(-)
MKEQTIITCIILFLNLVVFLYCEGHSIFSVFDFEIASQVMNVTCNISNGMQILCQNGSNVSDGVDYCWNFTIATMLSEFIMAGGAVCFLIWLLVNCLYFMNISKSNRTVNQMSYENESLQTKLIDRNLEIAELKRQLNSERNVRRPGGVDSSLPPYTEQENERGRILTINRLPDYQAVQ